MDAMRLLPLAMTRVCGYSVDCAIRSVVGGDTAGEVCETLLSLIGDAEATAADSRYDIERQCGGAV